MLTNEELKELYFEWIVEETMNDSLTRDTAGVKLSLDLLCKVDPFEYNPVTSESIDGLSQTFAVDERGIPTKIFTWLSPYYMVGSLIYD